MHDHRWKPHWDPDEVHPDLAVVQDFARLRAAAPEQTLSFSQLASRPDCFPALCVAAAMRVGETRFTEIPALRIKESDRLRAIRRLVTALGGETGLRGDALTIAGGEAPSGGRFDPGGDHRMAMAAAIAGALSTEGLTIEDPGVVAVSQPTFFEDLARLTGDGGSEP